MIRCELQLDEIALDVRHYSGGTIRTNCDLLRAIVSTLNELITLLRRKRQELLRGQAAEFAGLGVSSKIGAGGPYRVRVKKVPNTCLRGFGKSIHFLIHSGPGRNRIRRPQMWATLRLDHIALIVEIEDVVACRIDLLIETAGNARCLEGDTRHDVVKRICVRKGSNRCLGVGAATGVPRFDNGSATISSRDFPCKLLRVGLVLRWLFICNLVPRCEDTRV